MASSTDLTLEIVTLIDALPLPAGPGRLVERRHYRDRVVRLSLAVAVATVAILLIILASPAERREVPAEQPSATPAPSPTTTPPSLTPQEILLNARRVLAGQIDFKYRLYHTGPATQTTPVIARRGTEWELTVRVHCAPQRHHTVLHSTSDRLYQESVYFSPTDVWLRSQPDDPWQHLSIKGGAICGDETAPLQLASGGWDQLNAKARSDGDLPCGSTMCFVVVAEGIDFYFGGVIAGKVTERVLVEQGTFRPVQVRYFLEWNDGRSAWEVQDFYDYGVPNEVEAPK